MLGGITNRVSGLASGMDTEKIIGDLIKAKSARLTKYQQDKVLNTWKIEAYREINLKIDAFKKAVEDVRLEGPLASKLATSTDSRVDATYVSSGSSSSFTISAATLAEPAKAGSVSFATGKPLGTEPLTETAGFSFTLNGTSVTIPANSTFDSAIAAINAANTGVKASNVGGSLVLTNSVSGSGKDVTIAGLTGTNSLGLENGSTDGVNTAFATAQYTTGSNAVNGSVTINGTAITIAENTFTYEGVKLTLKGDIAPGSTIGVNIGSDPKKTFDKIKNFVDKYNEIIADLHGKVSEKKDRDFHPLSDDEKKAMTPEQVKAWEDKAKAGLLRNDPIAEKLLTQMRKSLSEIVVNPEISTSFDSLDDIGITPSKDWQENGKLLIDESKLNAVLETNIADVTKLFTIKSSAGTFSETTLTNTQKYTESGFGQRIFDSLNLSIKELGARAFYSNNDMSKEADMIKRNITREQEKLSKEENRLWQQFTAMEKGLQRLNDQSMWLSQQLGL